MKRRKTSKTIALLCLAFACCLALTSCGSNDSGGGGNAVLPQTIYTGGTGVYSEPAPNFTMVESTVQSLQLYEDGTYLLIVNYVSVTSPDQGRLSLFYTALNGHYTAAEADEDTGYQTITLTDTVRVYASGDYNAMMLKPSVRTEIWSDDASLTEEEQTVLLDIFGLSNAAVEVNIEDKTFQNIDFNVYGAIDIPEGMLDRDPPA